MSTYEALANGSSSKVISLLLAADERLLNSRDYGQENEHNFEIIIAMPKFKTIFESSEDIHGVVPRANDWVRYACILKVKDGGKMPISIVMKFIPPHPFSVNMPLEHSLKAESFSGLYWKVVKFLAKYGVEFRG